VPIAPLAYSHRSFDVALMECLSTLRHLICPAPYIMCPNPGRLTIVRLGRGGDGELPTRKDACATKESNVLQQMSLIIESLPPRSPGISLRPLFVFGALLSAWFISVALSTGLVSLGSHSSVILSSTELGRKLIPVLASFYALHAFIAVPSELSHLPRAPLLPILKSYLRGEPDDVRYRRYILPLLDEAGHGVVLVWVLGRWMVHVLDWKLGRAMAENAAMEKESPPDHLLLWDLIGRRNFILANGPLWRRHAAIVKSGFTGPVPMDVFTHQSRLLFGLIGYGGRIHVNGWSQRYALAVAGTA
jgi:hypothetical protein